VFLGIYSISYLIQVGDATDNDGSYKASQIQWLTIAAATGYAHA
jgi:hypothetical protein